MPKVKRNRLPGLAVVGAAALIGQFVCPTRGTSGPTTSFTVGDPTCPGPGVVDQLLPLHLPSFEVPSLKLHAGASTSFQP